MKFRPWNSKLITSVSALAIFGAVAQTALASNKNGPTDGDIGFQRSVTPVMDMITTFNVGLVWLMSIIVVFVLAMMIFICVRFREKANPVPSKTSHNTMIEVVWTLAPVLILMVLAVPSMRLLYFADTVPEEGLVIKATGNTWNWEYSYPDYEDKVDGFVSNIVDIANDEKRDANGNGLSHAQIISKIDARPAGQPTLNGRPYLFATDAPLVVPVDTVVKVIVTSNVNIHAFAVPQFGVKVDAVPGRLNETWFKVKAGEEGTYYGQCSEICGLNHAFMPIEVQVVSKAEFNRWIANGGTFTAQHAQNNINSDDSVRTVVTQ